MGVNVVKLEDVCEFYRGLTYSKKDEATFSDNIVLRASNIDLDTSTLILDDLKYLKEDFVIPNDKKLQKDCIFICMSSGSKSHLGKVAYIDRDYNYAFGGFMGLIKPKTNILPRYLFYLLQTPEYKELIKKLSNGININNIKFSDLKEFQFELPSLEEQEKALNILDKADEIRAKKKLANDKLDEFLKSTYIDLFAENTKKVKLEELCYFITKGTTPKAQDMSQDSGDIPYIKVYNLRFDTRLDFTINPTFVTKESHKNFLARSVVYPGDVLMNIVGPPLCKVSIVPDTYPEWNINQAIARFRCNKGLNNLYLAWFLTTPFAEKQMLRNAKKTSGQLNLTLEICKNIEIPLPDIEQQNKFAQIVEKVEAQKQKNEQVIKQMDNLFNSLSQRAFKGEL